MEKESRSRSASVLLNDFLKLALGISDKTAANVADQIQKDGELAAMKQHVRETRGEAATQLNSGLTKLKKQIDDMKKDGDGDEEAKPDFADVDKDGDEKEPVKKAAEEKEDKKDVKEGTYTFMNHLLNELQIDVDLDDPAASMAAIKTARRMGTDRTRREQVKNTKAEMKDIDSSSPTGRLDKQIAQQKLRLNQLEKQREQLASKQ